MKIRCFLSAWSYEPFGRGRRVVCPVVDVKEHIGGQHPETRIELEKLRGEMLRLGDRVVRPGQQ